LDENWLTGNNVPNWCWPACTEGMELGFALEFLESIQVLQVSEETNLEPLILHWSVCLMACAGWDCVGAVGAVVAEKGVCRVLDLAVQSSQSNLETRGALNPWWQQRVIGV
jgi:hypothetical protein